MAPPIVVAFTLGMIGAVGAKIGTEQIYPWILGHAKNGYSKITKKISDIKFRKNIDKNMENI